MQQAYNLDMAYSKVGAYGRMQWLLTFVNSIARNSGTYVYYPFAYLVLEQMYLCKNPSTGLYETCSNDYICEHRDTMTDYGADYVVDTSYEYYLQNWFLEMDLVCMPATTIGFMITAYYIGFAIGGLFFAIPDKYGRQISIVFGLTVAIIGQALMLYWPNYWVRMACFFILGLSQIKNSVSYVWLTECVPLPYKSTAIIAISLVDAVPMGVTCFYFMYISKDWFYLSFFMLMLSVAATLLAFVCPESPRWLLVNGRRTEAIQALNKMAAWNGSPHRIPESASFVEDPNNF